MPETVSFEIKPADVAFVGSSDAVISSPSLLNSLIKKGDKTVSLLGKNIAPVDPRDLSVDQYGRVRISNPAFVEALKKVSSGLTALDNGGCGNNCQC